MLDRTAITLSPQQQAVVSFARDGRGSAFGEAVAGAGKTTTALMAVAEMRGSVAVMAFNKAAAVEFGAKAHKLGLQFNNRVRFGTCHSFGLSGWRRAYPDVQCGPEAAKKKREMTVARYRQNKIDERLDNFALKLCSLAKQAAIGLGGDIDDKRRWYDIVEHHDLAYEIEAEDDGPVTVDAGVDLAIRTLKYHRELAPRIIDFDDMIYMPVVSGIKLWQNDWVVGDEWQDANVARRALARKMLRPGGRALFIGDRHQAIYGFCHPPGTKILTPSGYKRIETLTACDEHIAVSTSCDVAGWKGEYRIKSTTHNYAWDYLLEVRTASGKKVRVTPHHRIPVRVDVTAPYITYVMRRAGKFRVGYMAMYANAGANEKRFMLSQRSKMEGADAAWILASHVDRFDAIMHEAVLHKRGAFGGSFAHLTGDEIEALPQDASYYHSLLAAHGRFASFPIWVKGRRQHFECGMPFLTEACNIVPGMRVQVLGKWDERRRGRSRHLGTWESVSVTRLEYDRNLPTYGISVSPLKGSPQQWSLYVADGIVVHNTGADSDSIAHTIRDFSCIELPMTVTFRCPKAVVAEARKVVSHIEAHESAPDGKVEWAEIDQILPVMTTSGPQPVHECGSPKQVYVLQPDDAVLCRLTRPLVSLAFQLIKRGTACHVEGRDIGAGLIKLLDRFKSARTLVQLRDRLGSYAEREYQRLIAKGRETQAEALMDRVETLYVLMEGCSDTGCVRQRVRNMFVDGDDEVKKTLTLATVHRSKGREWGRVFVLGRDAYMPSPWARQEWAIRQELNIIYVAVTRAQRELVLISMPKE